jgi:N-formylglutamate deformylase
VSDLLSLKTGTVPLIFSVPHAGTDVPENIAARLTDDARKLPDTDWHVHELYDFAGRLGASMLKANVSRYVIDLNRPPDDESLYPGQATTGLCPPIQFDGTPIYRDGGRVSADEVAERREKYWQPYHNALAAEIARVKAKHGNALVYDCHSIASRVPRLFDGLLPDLNLGTVKGESCAPGLEKAIAKIMAESGLSHVVNSRFVGGYITRHYGRPGDNVHAVQMEKGQDCHLARGSTELDQAKCARLKPVLQKIAEAMLAWRA